MNDRERMVSLIHQQFDGVLDVAGQRRLRAWIMADDEHARIFARESIVHHRIHENLVRRDAQSVREAAEASGESGHGFLNDLHELEERADQRQLVQLSEAEAAAKRGRQMGEADRDNLDRLPFHSSAPLTPVRHIVIPRVLVYVAAAAMALIVVGLWLRSPRPPQSAPAPTPMVTAEPTDPATGPLVVAHLRGSIDAQWGVGESSPRIGDALPPGMLSLQAGLVEIEFLDGARVIVEAPANLLLETESSARLNAGRLVGYCPPRARGFTVRTPTATIVDHGTEFGVDTDADGATNVHVFTGEVSVALARDADTPPATVRSDQAIYIDKAGRTARRAASQPYAFVRGMTSEARDPMREYVALVAEDQPIAHFRFEAIDNNVTFSDGSRPYTAHLLGEFSQRNDETGQWLRFHGDTAVSYFVIDQTVRELASGESYTIEMMIAPKTTQIVQLLALIDPARGGENAGMGGLALQEAGDIFWHRPDRATGVADRLVSDRTCPLNTWTHVVAVKDGNDLVLYLNGRESARAESKVVQNIAPRLEVGHWTGDRAGRAFFAGDLDEFAVYDRALSAADVAARVDALRRCGRLPHASQDTNRDD